MLRFHLLMNDKVRKGICAPLLVCCHSSAPLLLREPHGDSLKVDLRIVICHDSALHNCPVVSRCALSRKAFFSFFALTMLVFLFENCTTLIVFAKDGTIGATEPFLSSF